jgi:hypothetical protein
MSPVLLGFGSGWTPDVSWEAYIVSLLQAVGISGMPGRNERNRFRDDRRSLPIVFEKWDVISGPDAHTAISKVRQQSNTT